MVRDNKCLLRETMYVGYITDCQDLGFICLNDIKDIENVKQIRLILKTGLIYIAITIIINSSLSGLKLINQSSSDKPSHERIISSQKFNILKGYNNRGLNVL